MVLLFTLPAGLFSEQHTKIVREQEEMALQVLQAEFAAWQRLGSGRFLGAKQYNSYVEGRQMGTGCFRDATIVIQ